MMVNDDLDRLLANVIRRSHEVAETLRWSGMVQYELTTRATPNGVAVRASAYPPRRQQMLALRVCEVPGFLPVGDRGLLHDGRVLSFDAIVEYLERLFRYVDLVERTRWLQLRRVTVGMRGLSLFAGPYRLDAPIGEIRFVDVPDLYHTSDGHPLKAAAVTGKLAHQLTALWGVGHLASLPR